jgi:hypothetical protein
MKSNLHFLPDNLHQVESSLLLPEGFLCVVRSTREVCNHNGLTILPVSQIFPGIAFYMQMASWLLNLTQDSRISHY